jgi:hypothetical protein
VNFQSSQAKQKQKFPPKFDKILGCYNGAEAVLSVEITHKAPRVMTYDKTTSTEALQDNIDALDEARDKALARAMQYQQSLRNYHSSRVHP